MLSAACAAALTLAACGPAPEETAPPDVPMLSPEESRAALEIVRDHVAEIHLDTRTGLPPDFADAVEAASDELSEPIASEQLLFVLDEALVSLHDAHTFVDVRSDALASKDGVDLPFVWLEEGLVVTEDAGPLQRGDAIQSIGGLSPADLLAELRSVLPSENDPFLRDRAPRVLPRGDFLRRLAVIQDDLVALQVERGGAPVTVELPLGALGAPAPSTTVAGEIDAANSLAVLRMDTCVYDGELEATLASFFGDVAGGGIQRVAVDLRRNEGGNVLAAFAFLRYVEGAAGMKSFGVDLRISDPLLDQFPVFGSPELVQALSAFGVDTTGDHYDIPGPVMGGLLASQLSPPAVDPALVFGGELYVIVSPRTFSSANLFATLVKDNQLGQIIGEPTGNEVDFHGQNVRLDIPGTDLFLSVSSSRNRRPETTLPNEPSLTPDVVIPVTRESIASGADLPIEWLRSLSP